MVDKVYVQTWGCQMNEYDSSKMVDVLAESGGAVQVTDPAQADILLLNTCSVREKAQEKVFSQLGRWKDFKKTRPDIIIGVGGCVASQEGSAIRERASFVDMVFGPQTLHRLPEMVKGIRENRKPVVDISFPEIEKFDNLPVPRKEGYTAFVSVMEGCSKYCSFCVVPYTRGEEVSRPLDSVLLEVAQLAENGAREITLLGQNVNGYRGAMSQDAGEADLALLIRYVAQIEGVERIRFVTSHPLEFSDQLIEVFADEPKLANYLHLPVQSGSDRILAMMKRGHTAIEYKSKIRRLREARPDISLSSDFIVGFPGETEADHQATMKLIEDIRFDQAFSFIYSRRPGTPASNLPDDVPFKDKQRRLAELQARINEFGAEFNQNMVGSIQTILVERPAKKFVGQLAGRTSTNRWVNFDGQDRLIGQLVDVEIIEALSNSLLGKIVTLDDQKSRSAA